MAKEESKGSVFEIIVVLAIVLIVAVTGQVLVYVGKSPSVASGSSSITGFAVVGNEAEEPKEEFLDIGVKDVEVDPASPLIGKPFEIKVTVANEGFIAIKTPFYVQVKIMPPGEGAEPIIMNSVIIKVLEPGEEAVTKLNMVTVTSEGAARIMARADSTAKLDDKNPSNDERSKTIIITAE